MARVLSAVSRREPSSARSAVSPSGWIRTLAIRPMAGSDFGRGFERGAGMCADKDGVEDAGQDTNTEQAGAREPDRPGGHHRGCGHVPGREVAPDVAYRSTEVEK